MQRALKHAQEQLKLLRRNGPHGLVVCASCERARVLSPPRPILRSSYRCDSRFHLEVLQEMLEATPIFGLVVVDGSEATLGTVQGAERKIVARLSSSTRGRTRRGGQSALRFDRLRVSFHRHPHHSHPS